jgi:hypothetical protein
MFSGLQEILLLLVIVVALLVLPRLLDRGRVSSAPPGSKRVMPPLSGRMRLAVVISVLWLLGAAVYIQPWRSDTSAFFFYGLLPVALFWGLVWVAAGFRARRR